jgi:hypothetical protein
MYFPGYTEVGERRKATQVGAGQTGARHVIEGVEEIG